MYKSDEELENHQIWIEEYLRDLKVLEDDIKFKKRGKSIYLAIDFFDLYEHCFPAADYLKGDDKKLDITNRDKFFKREIARCGFIYFLNNIYSHPLILLPPYLSESLDYLRSTPKKIADTYKKTYKQDINKFAETIIGQFKDLDLDNMSEDDFKTFLIKLNKSGPGITYLFSPSFDKGLEGYAYLLHNYFDPSPKELENYLEEIKKIFQMDSSHIYNIMNHFRARRKPSNKRDAKSIQYVEELNKKFGDDKILLLISSAEHFRKFRKSITCNKPISLGANSYPQIACEKKIDGRVFPLIRGTNTFYIALLEICNLIGRNNIKIKELNIDKISLDDLLKTISVDIITFENFLRGIGYTKFLSGQLKYDVYDSYREDIYKGEMLKEYIEERERSDLILIAKQVYPDIELCMDKRKIYNEYIYNTLKKIEQITSKEEFIKIFTNKIFSLEKQRMDLEQWVQRQRDSYKVEPIPEIVLNQDLKCIFETESINLEDILKTKDVNKLNMLFKEKGLDVFQSSEIIEIDPDRFVIIDKDDEVSSIYSVVKIKNKFNVYLFDLNLLTYFLYIINEKMKSHEINRKSLKNYSLISIIADVIIPVYTDLNYKYKFIIKDFYDQYIKNDKSVK